MDLDVITDEKSLSDYEVIMSIYNQDEENPLSPDEWVPVKPKVNVNSTYNADTCLNIYPLASSGNVGPRSIYYNRRDMSQLNNKANVSTLGKIMVSELLDEINAQLKITLSIFDIEDRLVPTDADYVLIRMRIDSLLYQNAIKVLLTR